MKRVATLIVGRGRAMGACLNVRVSLLHRQAAAADGMEGTSPEPWTQVAEKSTVAAAPLIRARVRFGAVRHDAGP